MTTIHIRITVPTITGVNVGAKGRLRWTPTLRRNVDPNTVVLPKGFDVDLVSGEARVNVAPTSANWCWKVEEGLYKVGVPNGTTRYVSVPDSETVINYIDLPDLDPSTLEPTAAPAAIWDVELSQVDERVTTLENAPPAHTHDNKDALDLVSGTNTGDEPDASDTVKGIVELATNTETATGTDTVRATTPAGVKAALDAKTVSDMSTYAAPTGADDRLQVAGVDVTPGQVGAAPALGADDNYVTDAEKLALHSHSNKTALDKVSGINTGDEPAASETVAGVVELATTAETTTGMDDTRAVTPVGVKAALDAKAASDMSTYATIAQVESITAYRKHPAGMLSFTQRSASRSLQVASIRTWETPSGVSYGVDHGWIAKTTDGWDTKTNSPFNTGQEPLLSLGAPIIDMVAWGDESLCVITSTKVLTMASFTSTPVIRLETTKGFAIAQSFFERGATRIVMIGEYTQNNLEAKKLYLSRDGGVTFTEVRQTVDQAGIVNNHWHATAYDPWGGALWASAGDDSQPPRELSFSLDWGVTWSSLTAPESRHLQPTAIIPLPTRVVVGRDAGGFAPGLDWWKRPAGQPTGAQSLTAGLMTFAPNLDARQVYPDRSTWCIGKSPDECYILFPPRGTGRGAIYATGDGGLSWYRVMDVTAAGNWKLSSDGVQLILAKVDPVRQVWTAPLPTWEWTAV